MTAFTALNSPEGRARDNERKSRLAAAPNIKPVSISPSVSLKSSPTKSQHSPTAPESPPSNAIGRLADLLSRSPRPHSSAPAPPTAISTQTAAVTEPLAESVPDDGDVEMSNSSSASPTGVRHPSEAPSESVPPASRPPSLSSSSSPASESSSSRSSSASRILQDTKMTAEDELIASQMLDDDERAELDETGLVAQTSESVPQSNAESVAEPENEGAVEPEYADSLLDAYDEVWPDAGKAKPISPTKHVVPGGLGRISIPLYQYPTGNSGVPHIISYLRRFQDEVITIDFLGRLQHYLWTLRLSGEGLGPSLVVLAQDLRLAHTSRRTDFHINTNSNVDLKDGFLTVSEYFRLGSNMARGIMTSDVEALLLSVSYGMVAVDMINHHGEGVPPKRRSVVRSGPSKPLSTSNVLGSLSSRLTRSRAGLSLVPATKPPYAQSSVAWTPEKAVNKFGKHLVKVNKGLPSDFRPEFSAGNMVRDSDDAGEVSEEHSSQVGDEDDEQDTLISAPSTPAPPPRLPPRRSSLKSFQPKTPSPRKKVAIQEPVVSPPTAPRSNGPSSRTRSRSATVEPSAVPSTPSKKATPRKKAVARKTTPRKKASVPSKSPVSRKKAAPPAVVASSASGADGPSSAVVEDSAGSDAVAPEGSVVENPVVPGNEVANVEPAAEAARSSSLLRSLSDYFGFLSG
ncbi:unnamed protein product [Alternaria alternata]